MKLSRSESASRQISVNSVLFFTSDLWRKSARNSMRVILPSPFLSASSKIAPIDLVVEAMFYQWHTPSTWTRCLPSQTRGQRWQCKSFPVDVLSNFEIHDRGGGTKKKRWEVLWDSEWERGMWRNAGQTRGVSGVVWGGGRGGARWWMFDVPLNVRCWCVYWLIKQLDLLR